MKQNIIQILIKAYKSSDSKMWEFVGVFLLQLHCQTVDITQDCTLVVVVVVVVVPSGRGPAYSGPIRW